MCLSILSFALICAGDVGARRSGRPIYIIINYIYPGTWEEPSYVCHVHNIVYCITTLPDIWYNIVLLLLLLQCVIIAMLDVSIILQYCDITLSIPRIWARPIGYFRFMYEYISKIFFLRRLAEWCAILKFS